MILMIYSITNHTPRHHEDIATKSNVIKGKIAIRPEVEDNTYLLLYITPTIIHPSIHPSITSHPSYTPQHQQPQKNGEFHWSIAVLNDAHTEKR